MGSCETTILKGVYRDWYSHVSMDSVLLVSGSFFLSGTSTGCQNAF